MRSDWSSKAPKLWDFFGGFVLFPIYRCLVKLIDKVRLELWDFFGGYAANSQQVAEQTHYRSRFRCPTRISHPLSLSHVPVRSCRILWRFLSVTRPYRRLPTRPCTATRPRHCTPPPDLPPFTWLNLSVRSCRILWRLSNVTCPYRRLPTRPCTASRPHHCNRPPPPSFTHYLVKLAGDVGKES